MIKGKKYKYRVRFIGINDKGQFMMFRHKRRMKRLGYRLYKKIYKNYLPTVKKKTIYPYKIQVAKPKFDIHIEQPYIIIGTERLPLLEYLNKE